MLARKSMLKGFMVSVYFLCTFFIAGVVLGYVPVKKEVMGAWKVESKSFKTQIYHAALSVKGRHEFRFENNYCYHLVDGRVKAKAFWGIRDGDLRFVMLTKGAGAFKRKLKISFTPGTRDKLVLTEASGEGFLVTVLTRDYASELILAAKSNNLHKLLVALKSGVSPDGIDKSDKNRTALHFAAEKGFVEIVEALLMHKAKKDLKDSEGKTASDLSKSKGHSEITKILEESASQDQGESGDEE